MFRIVTIAAMMLAFSMVAVQYIDRASRPAAPVPPIAAVAAGPVLASPRSLVIRAGKGGHFAVEALVDGRPLTFLVDTGASQIALRESDAARLGFRPAPRDYSVKMATANGEGRAALVHLATVEVGSIMVRDLLALVTPDAALGVNLLGMSFLSRVRWSHERGKLVIEQ